MARMRNAGAMIFLLAMTLLGSPQLDAQTVMRPDAATRQRWTNDYESAPPAFIDPLLASAIRPRGSVNLLSHLEYVVSERDQGSCGNCWVWAGTGVLAIAMNFAGVGDRLSVQYLNSCSSADYACCGGWLSDFADFYTFEADIAIPWSNTNASWQDGGRVCSDAVSLNPCGAISTTPSYPISSILATTISTQSAPQATAISNIKNVLNQNRAVWMAFYLPEGADWDNFVDTWYYGSPTQVWNPDFSCGHSWEDGEGGAHAVLVVGYSDDDPDPANHYWLVLNSWGTAGGNRPDGVFRMSMNMDYGCTYHFGFLTYYSFYFQTLAVTFDLGVEIFADGLESGDTSLWSSTVP